MNRLAKHVAAMLLIAGFEAPLFGAENPFIVAAQTAAPASTTLTSLPAGNLAKMNALKGWNQLNDPQGTGGAVAWQPEFNRSAKALASDALHQLSNYFDESPVCRGAVVDAEDNNVQAVFSARLHGVDVSGVMLVCVDKSDPTATAPPNPLAQPNASDASHQPRAWVAAVYDHPVALRASGAQLLTLLAAKAPAFVLAEAKAQEVVQAAMAGGKEVMLCDGSLIHLPRGWSILFQQPGSVTLQGPNDMTIALGGIVNFATPDGDAQWRRAFGVSQAGMPIAPYRDVKSALAAVAERFNQLAEPRGEMYRLIEVPSVENIPVPDPLSIPNMPPLPRAQHAVVTTVFEVGKPSKPVRAQCLADVTLVPLDQGHWSFVFNAVDAPAADFEKDKPLLLAIAFSYRFNAEGYAKAMQIRSDAQQSVINSINRSTYNMIRTSDRNFRAMDAILTDGQEVTDSNGHKFIVSMTNSKQAIDNLNKKWGTTFKPVEIK